jgi:hypothetical protein
MRLISRALHLSVCSVLLCTTLGAGARADEWNKKTLVTFHEPVEIPGHVLLPGDYVFKLASDNDRHAVQIWSGDESYIIATILTVPAYRVKSTDNTQLLFEERRSGSPIALHAWFYPGDDIGNEFLYPTR